MDNWIAVVVAAQLLRIALPYLGAALAGGLNESAGVIDVALEGKLLASAFAAAVVAHATGSIGMGLCGGIAAAVLVTWLQAVLCVRLAADAVLVGVGINLFVAGTTRYLLYVMYGTTANSPQGPRIDALASNPVLYLLAACAAALPWIYAHTPLGLRIRAAGEHPRALELVGLSPQRLRQQAMLMSCIGVGLGGAAMSLSLGKFVADMSGGRGYIAIAIALLGRREPRRIAAWCIAFAALETAGIRLQLHAWSGVRELLAILPHLALLAVLAAWPRANQTERAAPLSSGAAHI